MLNKSKKMYLALTMCLSVALLLVSVSTFAVTNASAKVVSKQPKPVITNVGTVYSLNDVVTLKVTSTNYTKKVQYRAYLTNLSTKKKVELTKGYTKADYAKNASIIKYSAKTAGKYTVTVYAKPYNVNMKSLPYTAKTFTVYNGMYILKANTVVASKTIKGNVYIKANNVTLNKIKVTGTVYINPGSNGTTKLNNVVASNVRVLSGATKSIYLNSVSANKLYVDSTSNVRIVVSGTTQVDNTIVTCYTIFDKKSGSVGTVTITEDTHGVPTVTLNGTFDEPIIVASSANITAGANSKISALEIAPTDSNSKVQLAGTFASVSVTKEAGVTLAKGTVISNTLDVAVPVNINVGENAQIGTLNTVDGSTVELGQGTKVETATGSGTVAGEGTVADNQIATPTPVPTVAPTATPVPTAAPTATPVPTVAPTATPVPTVAPTVAPTATPVPVVVPPVVPPAPTPTPTSTANATLISNLNTAFLTINNGIMGLNSSHVIEISPLLPSGLNCTSTIGIHAAGTTTVGSLAEAFRSKMATTPWNSAYATSLTTLKNNFLSSLTINGMSFNTYASQSTNLFATLLNTPNEANYNALIGTIPNASAGYSGLLTFLGNLIPVNGDTLNSINYGTLNVATISVGGTTIYNSSTTNKSFSVAEIDAALGINGLGATPLSTIEGKTIVITLTEGSNTYTYTFTIDLL